MHQPISESRATNIRDQILNYARRYWFLVLVLGLLVLGQYCTFSYFWGFWSKKDSYYSHGPIVPVLALYILWYRRKLLQNVKYRGSWFGLPLLFIGLLVMVVAITFSWEPLYGVAFLLVLVGCIVSVLGMQVMNILLMPVSFLITMIPLPANVLDAATIRYQFIATAVAARILDPIVGGVTKTGNLISSSSLPQPLLVGTPCSGLRLLVALIMCSLFLSFMLEGRWWKKVILVALSFPFSICINAARIVMIGLAGYWTDSADVMHSFHDYSGYIGLAICAFAVIAAAMLLGMRRFVEPPEVEYNTGYTGPKSMLSIPGLIAVVLLIGSICFTTILGSMYHLPKGKLCRSNIPRQFGTWVSQDLDIDKDTLDALSSGDLLSRAYSGGSEDKYIQVFIDASLDLSAFHSPRICLPGSGVKITKEEIIPIHLNKPENRIIRATLLHTESNLGNGYLIYWYTCGEHDLANAAELLRFTHQNRLRDLMRIASNPANVSEVRSAVLSRQITWYRFSVDSANGESDLNDLKQFAIDFVANNRHFWE